MKIAYKIFLVKVCRISYSLHFLRNQDMVGLIFWVNEDGHFEMEEVMICLFAANIFSLFFMEGIVL